MNVKGVEAILPQSGSQATRSQDDARDGRSFSTVLGDALVEVNRLQGEADQAVEDLVTGAGVSLHETMIALEKADLSFRLMMQVRNKIVQAYREVLSMQV